MPRVDILVVALTAPILINVYEKKVLLKSFKSSEQGSTYLPDIFKYLMKNFDIDSITYANGPGSFMAIKISYLFLKSLEIVNGIKLYATLAFEFNEYSPIKAFGKLYFHYEKKKILVAPLGSAKLKIMRLPEVLNIKNYSIQTQPNYILPVLN